MLIEVGHFALVLALIISVLLIVVPSIGLYQNKTSLAQLARPLVWAQGFWIALAFFVLMGAFLSNDFSVKYVADNSNTQLPILFKASAVWGSHEGSLLLWVFVLSLWTVAVSIFSKRIPSDLINQTLVVLGAISFGFLLFLLFTSNPFERLMMPPLEGRELNPLLQDFGSGGSSSYALYGLCRAGYFHLLLYCLHSFEDSLIAHGLDGLVRGP